MTNIFSSDNWRAELDGANIVWLHFDKKDESANSLSKDVLEELTRAIEDIKVLTPKGLIILSDKKSGFIAGADIKEFTKIKNEADAYTLIKNGQAVMDSIEALPFPTVAMIHGFCLGGGLELALACDWRVAEDSSSTKLGLPEVLLGIHPGFGGTVRLPRLVGTAAAMNLILSGHIINVKWAKKIGLVDATTPLRHLEKAAVECIKVPPKRKKLSFMKKLLNKPVIRSFVKKSLHKRVEARAPFRHYPAPHEAIDIATSGLDSPGRMEREAKSVSGLILGGSAQNLIKLFFLRERMKGLGKASNFKPRHVHVIGAGVMGGDIASWCVLNGMRVTLQDREAKFIAPAISRAYKFFSHKLKDKKHITDAMDRLIPDVGGKIGIGSADVIIEAIFENLEAKRELFKLIEPLAKRETVLASNTSSLPIEDIAEALEDKSRLVGIHFFNPVAKMPLVEIVASPGTSEEVIEKASAFTTFIGKLPLPVKSTPGFLVNRILMPYLLEAITMVDEGIKPALIDRAAMDFGMPMGPVLLADTVGLDICLHVAEVLADGLGGSDLEIIIPESLKTKVGAGKLGLKTGRGYYKYKNSQAIELLRKTGRPDQVIGDRLIFSIINESAHCLADNVAQDSDLIDGGMVFGTGFAPFTGGPLNYLKSFGAEAAIDKLKKLEKIYGKRFHPSSGLDLLK